MTGGAPALCEACHTVEIVNYLEEKSACPKCEGSVTFYDDLTLRRKPRRISSRIPLVFSWKLRNGSFKLPDTEYRCPKCGEIKMRFFDAGVCWD